MTPTHLAILRTINAKQPIMKNDIYRSVPDYAPHTLANYLSALQDMGYIQYERKRGPVWLTLKGLEVVNEI